MHIAPASTLDSGDNGPRGRERVALGVVCRSRHRDRLPAGRAGPASAVGGRFAAGSRTVIVAGSLVAVPVSGHHVRGDTGVIPCVHLDTDIDMEPQRLARGDAGRSGWPGRLGFSQAHQPTPDRR